MLSVAGRALLQGHDLRRRLISVQPPPILEQFRLMDRSPFDDQRQGARRQGPLEQADRCNPHLRLGVSIAGQDGSAGIASP